jgi:diguanylate cyclase (GGDEF)-like protein
VDKLALVNQLNQLFRAYTYPEYMRTLIRRYGVARTTLLLSTTGFLVSLAIMTPINLLTNGSLFTGLIVTAFISCTVLPFHLYQLGQLLARLEAAQQALYNTAIRDELTQVYNRRYFVDQLHLHRASQADGKSFAIVLLDIDNFKLINDTFGHAAGDLVLQQVSRLCTTTKCATDLFARYGGEEFVFLLDRADYQQALKFAEQTRLAIAQMPCYYEYQSIHCTVSIGVAVVANCALSPEKWLMAADQALYTAKRNGKNQVALALYPLLSQTITD